MKKLILFTIITMTLVRGNTQVTAEILDPFVFENIDINTATDLPVHILLTNTTTDTINVKWEILRGNCVENWDFLGCDNNQCYSKFVSSNVDPDFPIDKPSVMPPNNSYQFIFHILPNLTTGCCDIEIEFSLVEEQENILASVNLPIQINDSSCITSTNENLLPNLILYPNPFTEAINLDNAKEVRNIRIYDLKGKLLHNQLVNGNYISNLDQLNNGIYLLVLYNEQNEILNTRKIVKE